MSGPASAIPESKRIGPWIVLAMVAMVAIPAAITLHTAPAPLPIRAEHTTSHGYTWSLLLFLVPIVVIAFWFVPQEGVKIPKQAFWRTIGVLVPFGCALDFFFAHRFFIFPNPDATLKIPAPALGGPVPVEEYVFYLTGFIAILLVYVWLDEFWLAAYNVPDYADAAKNIRRLLQFHPTSAVLGVALIAGAILYKKFFALDPSGVPGYFTFLVATALVPAASFYPTAKRFINWRALSLTLFFFLLVSLLWEATMALPFGWWGYQPHQMMGISVDAWSGLPLEAICVWIAVTYATAVLFEVFKLWQASGKSVRQAFLGNAPR